MSDDTKECFTICLTKRQRIVAGGAGLLLLSFTLAVGLTLAGAGPNGITVWLALASLFSGIGGFISMIVAAVEG